MKQMFITILAATMLLGGCQEKTDISIPVDTPAVLTQDNELNNQQETNEFTPIPPLVDERQITKVYYFRNDISNSINKNWLLAALKHSTTVSNQAQTMNVDYSQKVNLEFSSNMQLSLNRLMNPNSTFTLISGDKIYVMQSEEICIWLDYLNDVFLERYSARGTVTEIDEQNKMFIMESVDSIHIYKTLLSDSCNVSFEDISIGDNLVCLFSDVTAPESEYDSSSTPIFTARYIIIDNYEQLPDNISN